MLLAGVKNVRFLVLIPISAFLAILILWVSRPDIPARAVEHIKGKFNSHSNSTSTSNSDSNSTAAPLQNSKEESWWFEDKWPFQADVLDDYDLPTFNREELRNYPPHNYKGPGQPTFATFYASRNATDRDPYFVATQQVIYRLLWDPKTKSKNHPVTVFVPKFISEEQRE